ncbi:MAG: hypothetical protein ACO32I_06215 [Candidatus Limnocylindrus sp.]
MLSFNQILDIINATQNLTILSRENSLYVIENFDEPDEGSLNIENNENDGIEVIWLFAPGKTAADYPGLRAVARGLWGEGGDEG